MIYPLFVFISTYVCFVSGQSNLNSSCSTPMGTTGLCVSLKDCPQLLALVQNPSRTPDDVTLLRKSQCGYSNGLPEVCCNINKPRDDDLRCFTPDESEGSCIHIHSCPSLLNLLTSPVPEENKSYVILSRCEGVSLSVCCGPPRRENVIPSRNCAPSAAPPDPRSECCGLDSSSGNKIFGGNMTAIDQYPWLAMLEYIGTKDSKLKLLCGGVLISGRYVLTAGHCVKGPVLRVGTPTNVRLGEYDVSTQGPDCVPVEGGGEDCTEGTTIIPIEKIIAHPNYDPVSALRRNDIAILRLESNAPYTDFIRPICLPISDIATAANLPITLYAAGWGAVSDVQSFSNTKLHVDLPYRSIQECQPAYNISRRQVPLWQGQLCAGGIAGKDSCKGDSGGPLMSDNGRIYQVVGIVSFGPTPCGIENVPGVYTKVFQYLPWIRSQIKP